MDSLRESIQRIITWHLPDEDHELRDRLLEDIVAEIKAQVRTTLDDIREGMR